MEALKLCLSALSSLGQTAKRSPKKIVWNQRIVSRPSDVVLVVWSVLSVQTLYHLCFYGVLCTQLVASELVHWFVGIVVNLVWRFLSRLLF